MSRCPQASKGRPRSGSTPEAPESVPRRRLATRGQRRSIAQVDTSADPDEQSRTFYQHATIHFKQIAQALQAVLAGAWRWASIAHSSTAYTERVPRSCKRPQRPCRRPRISVIRCRSNTAFSPNRIGECDGYCRSYSTVLVYHTRQKGNIVCISRILGQRSNREETG